MATKSPLAPSRFPILPPIDGVRLSAGACGLRYTGRSDLMVAELAKNTRIAGVFTQSLAAAAPIDWCRRALKGGRVRAIVVNSGNANAFTGLRGREAVKRTAYVAAEVAECLEADVYIASTGVIGEPLAAERISAKLEELAAGLSADGLEGAARAIMTTDTYPKGAGAVIDIDGAPVTISGFAKGSGMIAPDMATMLSFIFTDAPLTQAAAQVICEAGVADTFNAITIDGDTSTSDTVLVFATGAASARGVSEISDASDARGAILSGAVEQVMRDLAHQVVKDGEGLSKFIAITVQGAQSEKAARTIGFSIANSPLVKTAFSGEDPNWGRIVMAVGKSGEAADRDKLAIWFGDIRVAVDGEVDPAYIEDHAAAYMKGAELEVRVNVGIGSGSATVWPCDLTPEYISINADYRS